MELGDPISKSPRVDVSIPMAIMSDAQKKHKVGDLGVRVVSELTYLVMKFPVVARGDGIWRRGPRGRSR